MHGLDSFILPAPFSLIVSILLIISCDNLGNHLLKISGLYAHNGGWLRWQAPIIGLSVLSILLYPLALVGYAYLTVLKSVAILLIILSLSHYYRIIADSFSNITRLLNKTDSFEDVLIILLLTGYGLLTFSPITDADSLDYHVGVALHILNTGNVPYTPEWFHSRLSGNGEVLNALGLAIGGEQFPSLMQFSGLVGVFGLIRYSLLDANISMYQDKLYIYWKQSITVIAISAPVIVALVATSKPQMLPIAMTIMALVLVVNLYSQDNTLNKRQYLVTFIIVCALVMTASQLKFTYFLGGGVVGIIGIIIMIRMGLIMHSVIIGCVMFSIILIPTIVWKASYFGGGYIESLITPFPGGWPGTDKFETVLRNASDGNILLPFSFIIPSGLSHITTIIGLGSVSFIFLKPGRDAQLWIIILAAMIVFLLAVVIGPSTSRSYMEPFLWLLLVISNQKPNLLFVKYNKIFMAPIYVQAIITIMIIFYGVMVSILGGLNESYRTDIMMRFANGYEVMRWVDKELPDDAVILLSNHRAMGLSPRKTVSHDWGAYLRLDDPLALTYINILKDKKVTHVLFKGDSVEAILNDNMLFNCMTDEIYGPGYGRHATRNPFHNNLKHKYWLFSLDHELFPSCIGGSSHHDDT